MFGVPNSLRVVFAGNLRDLLSNFLNKTSNTNQSLLNSASTEQVDDYVLRMFSKFG